MVLSTDLEIIEISGEYLAVPIGKKAENSRDVFSFSKAGAFIVMQMKTTKTREELINSLIAEYGLDNQKACEDVDKFINLLLSYGVLEM